MQESDSSAARGKLYANQKNPAFQSLPHQQQLRHLQWFSLDSDTHRDPVTPTIADQHSKHAINITTGMNGNEALKNAQHSSNKLDH